MKKEKILSFLCLAAIITSLSACGKSDSESNVTEESTVSEFSEITTVTTVPETTTAEETTTTPEPVFEPCPDVSVDYIRRQELLSYYGYEYCIRNDTDKVITDIELAIMPLDENFLPMLKEPITDRQENANILPSADIEPGEAKVLGMLDTGEGEIKIQNGYQYYTAVVSYVKFRDGSEWKADNLQLWIDDVNMNYSKEDWFAERDKLKERAVKAESNEYLNNLTNIGATTWSGNDPRLLINTPDNLDITKVKSFSSIILLYDKKGKYVDYTIITVESKNASEINSGDRGWKLSQIAPDDLGYTKNIIYSIDFTNGESWSNPYSTYWLKYNQLDLDID